MTLQQIEQELRNEMKNLNFIELINFAYDIGVEDLNDMDRSEIEEVCVALEVNCFLH